MKKIIPVCMIGLFVLFSLAGCSKSGETLNESVTVNTGEVEGIKADSQFYKSADLTYLKGKKIGITIQSLQNAYWAGVMTALEEILDDAGVIRINGSEYSHLSPKNAAEIGISVIYQEFTNVPEMTVVENIFLGHPIKKGIMIDKKAMLQEVQKIFEQLHVNIDPMEQVKNLSVGYQQMVEIAKAIRQNTKILFMDEPTAPLTNSEVKNLFRIVHLLQQKGVTIIYISHRLSEIMELTDRVAVLRDGFLIDTLKTSETNTNQLIHMMVGREMNQKFPKRNNCIKYDKTVLELEHLSGNGDYNFNFDNAWNISFYK